MDKKTVKIRNIEIGAGIPKICIPVVAANLQELESSLDQLLEAPCDLVEWRADFYDQVEEKTILEEALKNLREKLGEKPLLFTFRTAWEGGNKAISDKDYYDLNVAAAATGMVDLVDVEVYRGEQLSRELIGSLHERGVYALGSNHDFHKTPEKDEIVRRLCHMQELNVDITKIAVMPQSRKDVLELLAAVLEMDEVYADRPCVSMSMSQIGVISRIIGGFSGSAFTFGTAGKASAPGQIPAEKLNTVLQILSESIG